MLKLSGLIKETHLFDFEYHLFKKEEKEIYHKLVLDKVLPTLFLRCPCDSYLEIRSILYKPKNSLSWKSDKTGILYSNEEVVKFIFGHIKWRFDGKGHVTLRMCGHTRSYVLTLEHTWWEQAYQAIRCCDWDTITCREFIEHCGRITSLLSSYNKTRTSFSSNTNSPFQDAIRARISCLENFEQRLEEKRKIPSFESRLCEYERMVKCKEDTSSFLLFPKEILPSPCQGRKTNIPDLISNEEKSKMSETPFDELDIHEFTLETIKKAVLEVDEQIFRTYLPTIYSSSPPSSIIYAKPGQYFTYDQKTSKWIEMYSSNKVADRTQAELKAILMIYLRYQGPLVRCVTTGEVEEEMITSEKMWLHRALYYLEHSTPEITSHNYAKVIILIEYLTTQAIRLQESPEKTITWLRGLRRGIECAFASRMKETTNSNSNTP